MRQSESPRQEEIREEEMELNKLKEDQDQEQEPHISGASIRTFVKQLRTAKDPINTSSNSQNVSKVTGNKKPHPPPPQQQPPHKRQVRRRLHTTRPYQERFLNMAEARREIVTALKFHRASMKKAASAGDQKNQPPHHDEPPRTPPIRSRKIPKTNPSSSSSEIVPSFPNLQNFYYPSSFPSFPILPSQNPDIIKLPEQTLGLNLNFHEFNNLDISLFQNGNVSSYNSNSNSSSSSSPTLSSVAADQEAPNRGTAAAGGGGGLHVAVGVEEMAEIRSIGEKHEMEWSDKMSLVKSAWWFRFLKNTEMGKGNEEEEEEEGYGSNYPFDQVLEFPDWLSNGNESCFSNDHYCFTDDYHSHDPDPALPCMDIGEFEGMDGEWLA